MGFTLFILQINVWASITGKETSLKTRDYLTIVLALKALLLNSKLLWT
jgi:hypothetical protein